jgi:hypothetical protein
VGVEPAERRVAQQRNRTIVSVLPHVTLGEPLPRNRVVGCQRGQESLRRREPIGQQRDVSTLTQSAGVVGIGAQPPRVAAVGLLKAASLEQPVRVLVLIGLGRQRRTGPGRTGQRRRTDQDSTSAEV